MNSVGRRMGLYPVLFVLSFSFFAQAPAAGQTSAGESPPPDGDVVFDGGGWGHGVGLSQYGAYGMAVLGSTHEDILTHYYQGSRLETLGPTSPIWVNLERNFAELKLSVAAVGSAPAEPVAISNIRRTILAQPGATITIRAIHDRGCQVFVENPGAPLDHLGMLWCNTDLVWYDWTSPETTPTTKLLVEECTLADWNTIPTSHPQCQYARGELHLRSGAGGLDLSAEMSLDDYVLGISEMPYFWGDSGGAEALRAQAVAARSYARELQLARGWVAANSCDAWCHVRDTTFDQRYVGWGHGNAEWVAAVESTAGVVVVHDDAPRHVVRAYYFSSSAGRTEAGHERFTSLDPAEYYSSVDDSPAVDGTVENRYATWTEVVPAHEVAEVLGFDDLIAVRVSATRPSSGSAALVEYQGTSDGNAVIVEKTGTWTRTTFGLRSESFTIAYESSAPLPTEEPVDPSVCVEVNPGDGWWTTTVRLGLPGLEYPSVREANLHAENSQGHLISGAEVCRPIGDDPEQAVTEPLAPPPTEDPVDPSVCVEVDPGNGWWTTTVRLGLPGLEYPSVREANLHAESDQGYLISGAEVCRPTDDDPEQPAPAPATPPSTTVCTVVLRGEGWWHQAEKLGIEGSQWPILQAANAGAVNLSGQLKIGATVCFPGNTAAPPVTTAPPASPAPCTVSQPGDGWIAVGERLGWPYSEWRTLAAANPQARNSAGSLKPSAEVCLP